MDILEKIAAQGKALMTVVTTEFGKIASPVVKLAMIALAVAILFWLVLEAFPILLLLALVVAAYVVIKAMIDDEGGRP